jgi:hypothetical protein
MKLPEVWQILAWHSLDHLLSRRRRHMTSPRPGPIFPLAARVLLGVFGIIAIVSIFGNVKVETPDERSARWQRESNQRIRDIEASMEARTAARPWTFTEGGTRGRSGGYATEAECEAARHKILNDMPGSSFFQKRCWREAYKPK